MIILCLGKDFFLVRYLEEVIVIYLIKLLSWEKNTQRIEQLKFGCHPLEIHVMKTKHEKKKSLKSSTISPVLVFMTLTLSQTMVGWLVRFYGISTFVGYLIAKSIFMQIVSSISNNSA